MASFTWPVAVSGYEWREYPIPASDNLRLKPIQKWPVRHYAPLEEFTGLFRTFAEMEPTPEGVLKFANQYGLLGGLVGIGMRAFPAPGTTSSDVSQDWQECVGRMRRAILIWEKMEQGSVTDHEAQELQDLINLELGNAVAARMVQDPKAGTLELRMWPLALRGALWLQLAQAVAGRKKFRACRSCGTWFELSPEVARTNRLFCSEGCRSKAYRERKDLAVRLAAEGKTPKEIAEEIDSDVKTVKGWLKQRKG
jgi:hypothetical protein